jgi:hypothetical protein
MVMKHKLIQDSDKNSITIFLSGLNWYELLRRMHGY